MAVRLKAEMVKEHDSKIQKCNFRTYFTTLLQWIHSSHCKQQVFAANLNVEIVDTTGVSQWSQVSGISNTADIVTRAIKVDQLKRNERLTEPVWLKKPGSEWPEQVNI